MPSEKITMACFWLFISMIICSNFNVDSEKYSLKACFYLMVESWQRLQLVRLLWSVELKSEALNYIIYTGDKSG